MLVSIVACTNPSKESSSVNESNAIESINEFLKQVSYPITITSKVTKDGDDFNGTYAITMNNDTAVVVYSYEILSTFKLVNGEYVVPESYKETVSGSVKIKNGKVIEQNGATVNLSSEVFNVQGISLSESVLKNVEVNNGTFSADVTSLQSLTGIDIVASNAKLNITYTDTKITKLVISYSTDSYQSEITYNFS